MIYFEILEFIERDDAMLKADIEAMAPATAAEMTTDKRRKCFTAVGKELLLTVAIFTIFWLLLADKFVDDTCFWVPPATSQIHVRLHWKSDRDSSPVIRTQVSNDRASERSSKGLHAVRHSPHIMLQS